jgi:hypothetical protein
MAVGDKWGGIVAERRWRRRSRTPLATVESLVFRTERQAGTEGEPNLTYPVVMTFLEDSIQVEYPTLGCTGILTALSYQDGTFRAREEITKGNCLQGVEVVLKRPASNQMEADFLVDGMLVAKGSLVKTPDL